jgi:thiamine-phosphate pyrophosphorylase
MLKTQTLEKFKKADLYPVISSEYCAGRDPIEVLKAIANAGAKLVQLREKNLDSASLLKLAEKFRIITANYEMILIINDDADLAASIQADGVHLGQGDTPLLNVKEKYPELFCGVSTHSYEEAIIAQDEGADYINIGPVFSTQTKTLSMPPLGIKIINEIIPHLNIPFTVMGGIKAKHIPELLKIGAKRIAMVTEITQAKNIQQQVKSLRNLWS